MLDLESALHYAASIGEGQKEPLSHGYHLSFRVGHAGDAATLANWYRQKKVTNHPFDEDTPITSTMDKNAGEKLDSNSTLSTISTTPTKQQSPEESQSAHTNPSPALVPDHQGAASSLELWLVDGLGDEECPPSLFALIADVTSSSSSLVDDTADESSNSSSSNNNNNKSSQHSTKLAAVALLTSSWENASRVLRLEWFRVDDHLPCKNLVERRMWLRLSLLSLATASELRVMDPCALPTATKTK